MLLIKVNCVIFTVSALIFAAVEARDLPISAKLIGGTEAQPHAYPYHVALQGMTNNNINIFCGGSLISEEYVLTAAFCVNNMKETRVYLGYHTFLEDQTGQVNVISNNIKIHEKYDPVSYINDIALVKLPSKVKLNDYIKTIAVDKGTSDHYSENALVTGWGKISTSTPQVTQVLNYLKGNILSNDDCRVRDTSLWEALKSGHMCLSYGNGVVSCAADAGGPLVVDNVQVGLVSFGNSRCTLGKPSVYTRVNKYKDWINKNCDNCGGGSGSGAASVYNKTYLYLLLVVFVGYCLNNK